LCQNPALISHLLNYYLFECALNLVPSKDSRVPNIYQEPLSSCGIIFLFRDVNTIHYLLEWIFVFYLQRRHSRRRLHFNQNQFSEFTEKQITRKKIIRHSVSMHPNDLSGSLLNSNHEPRVLLSSHYRVRVG